MHRKILGRLRSSISGWRNRWASAPEFWKAKLWHILAWPLLAIVVAVIGWHFLFMWLASERVEQEQRALYDAQALADGYARQVVLAVGMVEQAARIVQYQWQVTGGKVHLGYEDEQGLFEYPSRLVVAVIDGQGKLVTSTAAHALGPRAASAVLARVSLGLPVNFLLEELQPGDPASAHRLLFSRELTDQDGRFAGAVVVAVDPAYFTATYNDAVAMRYGMLAIVGDDARARALRLDNQGVTIRHPAFLHAPHLNRNAGTALASGRAWFADRRDRIVGWEHLDRYGVSALVGFDYDNVLAPYFQLRKAWISSATAATVALVLFTLVALGNAIRLARRNYELELIRSTYRRATEASNEGFYMLSPERENGVIEDFEIIDCNARAAELVARSQQDLIGKKVTDLYSGAVLQVRLDSLRRAMQSGYEKITLERPGPDFPARWVDLKLMRYGDNLAVSARDVTEERAHADELVRRSNEDPLTHLPNRYWIERHLSEAIARARRDKSRFAVLFLDLDGFKSINDTWGHAAGDELLCTAAHRLKEAVRPHDCVTRFGGDEFVVMLEGIAEGYHAAHVCERILRAFRQSIRLSYGEYVIGVSIGISMYPVDGTEPRTLLQNADVAMYSAKTSERGRFRFFDAKFHVELKERLERIRELRHALEHDQFVMHYEPRVRVAGGTITSFEALVRWVHPVRGLVPPVEFIPLVEETGLILQLGELVIDKVCAQLAQWRQHSNELVPVSVNISPRQVNETKVADILRRALERHGVPPRLLEVELTESSVMNETAPVLDAIRAIQRAGMKVLLDDFGTGYSSLSQLYKLNFDGLKIDRAFVLQLGKSEGGAVIINAIITMARALGMRVIAEGVESLEQLQMLRSLGCDEIQGYLVSKATPPEEIQPVDRHFVEAD
jgi:diguanylate cyclase (GGDEF)-like protein